MPTPEHFFIDAKTGTVEIRQLTDDEQKDRDNTLAEIRKAEDQQRLREQDKQSAQTKLKALGLTDDEIAALVG